MRGKHAPSARDKLKKQGADVITGGPEDFAHFIADESRKWSQIVRQAKIAPE